MKHKFFVAVLALIYCYGISITNSGCAQVGLPTGGPRDSAAPVLERANPLGKTLDFSGNKITLTFDEYVEVAEVQNNVLVSPLQKNTPDIRSNLRTVTIRLKDTLKPNTTYSIDFGNSIKDVNEGNIFKDYQYVFSTGNRIDSLKIRGRAFMAETGKIDTTMIVMLYRNGTDSSVRKVKPDYIARVRADGSFRFSYLPAGTFKAYALVDGDGGKTYNSKTEVFAFLPDNKDIIIGDNNDSLVFYASSIEKSKTPTGGGGGGGPVQNVPVPKKTTAEKKLRYSNNLAQGKQDLLNPLALSFNNPIKSLAEGKIVLTDTNYKPLPAVTLSFDSTKRILSVNTKWTAETNYVLLIDTAAVRDSSNNKLTRNDTLRFGSKRIEDYGRVTLRFSGLDLKRHPVLIILDNDAIRFSYPLTALEWTNQMFPPGEYNIRILYDDNSNGVWDTGDYSVNRQPEKTINLPTKLSIRANWDNDREVKL